MAVALHGRMEEAVPAYISRKFHDLVRRGPNLERKSKRNAMKAKRNFPAHKPRHAVTRQRAQPWGSAWMCSHAGSPGQHSNGPQVKRWAKKFSAKPSVKPENKVPAHKPANPNQSKTAQPCGSSWICGTLGDALVTVGGTEA